MLAALEVYTSLALSHQWDFQLGFSQVSCTLIMLGRRKASA